MKKTTLYNHVNLGSESKPLILNIEFKNLCDILRNGNSFALEYYLQQKTMVSAQISCANWIIENNKMKQIFKPYTEWEDFINGMYDISKKDNENDLIEKSISLLRNELMFFNVAFEMCNLWVVSASVNLSNVQTNRQSWIGQASCCYQFGVPEIITRIAWNKLTEIEKIKANLVADKIIRWYERKDKEIHSGMGNQMLF